MNCVVANGMNEVEIKIIGFELLELSLKHMTIVGIEAYIELCGKIEALAGIVWEYFTQECLAVFVVIHPGSVVISHPTLHGTVNHRTCLLTVDASVFLGQSHIAKAQAGNGNIFILLVFHLTS